MDLNKCPRCAWQSLETLITHTYCINCNYYEIEDDDYDLYVEKLTPTPSGSTFQVKQIESFEEEKSDDPSKKKIVFLVSDKRKRAA